MTQTEAAFADGNVSGTVRVGDTVRRATGPWTPAVHALLRHLRASGFTAVPDVLGIDDRGREILTYVEGETAPASLEGYRADETLVAVARLTRAYHDAVSGFRPPEDAAWRFTVGAPRTGEIVCHNDLAPWNTVFRDGEPIALIDWDFAAPAPHAWDLAYALWRWTPLYPDPAFGEPEERSRRIALYCAVYGWDDPAGLLPIVERRQRVLRDTLVAWGRTGVPGFAEMLAGGHADSIERDLAYLSRNRPIIESALRPR
jgi:hypothetical protein